MSDFLDDRRKEITDRLKELKPVVEEFHRLEAAVEALAGVIGSVASEAGSVTATTVRRRLVRAKKGRGVRAARANVLAKRLGPARPPRAPRRRRLSPRMPPQPWWSAKDLVAPKEAGKKWVVPPEPAKKLVVPSGKIGRPVRQKSQSPQRQSGTPQRQGKRAIEVVSLVQGQPGITIPELAAKMGIKQNYLYRVLPGLEQGGKLEKKGRGWYPKAA